MSLSLRKKDIHKDSRTMATRIDSITATLTTGEKREVLSIDDSQKGKKKCFILVDAKKKTKRQDKG